MRGRAVSVATPRRRPTPLPKAAAPVPISPRGAPFTRPALPLLRYLLSAALLLAACAHEADQVLVFGRGSDSVGLDPALEGDGESFKVCDNVYENLVTYEAGSTTVVPQLAKSWDVSEDRLTWTFHLRTGVRFHDGTPFDAEAMLFSLARQFDEDHPYHKVQGAYNYWNSMGMSDVVAAMEAADDSTFVVRLAEPNATFLATLGMNFCAAVSPTAVAAHGPEFFKNPRRHGTVQVRRVAQGRAHRSRPHRQLLGGAPTPEAPDLPADTGCLGTFPRAQDGSHPGDRQRQPGVHPGHPRKPRPAAPDPARHERRLPGDEHGPAPVRQPPRPRRHQLRRRQAGPGRQLLLRAGGSCEEPAFPP